MIYANREQAGKFLASEIIKLKLNPKKTVLVSVPRGGVIVGKIVSNILGIRQSAMVLKKIGAPHNRELAIGAVGARGRAVLDRGLIDELDVSDDYIKNETFKMKAEAKAREKYLGILTEVGRFAKKNVIIVDDGLATGQTARAAARIIKSAGVRKIILAVPVAALETVESLKKDFDKIICVSALEEFYAVGQFYRDFRSVSDLEVKKILAVDT